MRESFDACYVWTGAFNELGGEMHITSDSLSTITPHRFNALYLHRAYTGQYLITYDIRQDGGA